MKNLRNICTWLMSMALAGACVALGFQTYNGADSGAWSLGAYPETVRAPIALLAVMGGLLLVVPRLTWLGGVTMAGLLVGALGLELVQHGTGVFLPCLLLAPLAWLCSIRHPAAMALARLRSATDAFAEREIAAQALRLHPGKPRSADFAKPSQDLSSFRAARS
jgi:hypothetical protein